MAMNEMGYPERADLYVEVIPHPENRTLCMIPSTNINI